MQGPLEGVRVVELASWMFVPSGGAVLVDWGADVIKVEPMTGDPQRGLVTSGLLPSGTVNFMVEQPNHGKRSVALDLTVPDGREAFFKLIETADVFLTNYLPQVRRKLGVDVDDVRARNPRIVVARGSGHGPKGPEAEKGGFDGASFWARGGLGSVMPDRPDGYPMMQPSPAFGDVMGGLATAGAVAAALLKRERTGETSIVDVSLLSTALWQLSPLVVASKLFGLDRLPSGDRRLVPNPGVNLFRTSDGRFLTLMLLQSEKHWDDLAARLERPELVTDERFATPEARAANAGACTDVLDEAFGARPLAYWKDALADFDGVWTAFQTLAELYDDPQVVANGYLPAAELDQGPVQFVASPAQFDEAPVEITRAPEHGEHTELVLLELGYDWDDITSFKEAGAIL
jgi:crotonobetainyl-CoA:carnitine CoA-transferase CaiB-like acyl-CoA transferase